MTAAAMHEAIERAKRRACPCGGAMVYEPPEPGEAPTWGSPMGGAPATPGGWWCDECGRGEREE